MLLATLLHPACSALPTAAEARAGPDVLTSPLLAYQEARQLIIPQAESHGRKVAMTRYLKLHRRSPEARNIPESVATRGLLNRGHQMLPMYKINTSEAESQGQETGTFGGTARDHRRILAAFSILEAVNTKSVVSKPQHLKLSAVYKAMFHKRFL